MRTRRKQHSRLWVLLLYLALVTSLILSVTLARYSAGVTGTGAATVAAMAGETSYSTLQMPVGGLLPGGTATMTFQVVNFTEDAVSEVALDYQISVETTGNLPLEFSVYEGEPVEPGTGPEPTVHTLPYQGEFPLEKGRQTHTYTIAAHWPVSDTGEEKKDGYSQEIDLVSVKVEAKQRISGA